MYIPEEMFAIRSHAPNRKFEIFGTIVCLTSSSEIGSIIETFKFSSNQEAKDAVLLVKLST